MSETIIIRKRFCGPPASGNGGYSCGVIAEHCSGIVSVRLTTPPPLDTQMRFTKDSSGGGTLRAGDAVIAIAKPRQWTLEIPKAPSPQEATKAQAAYAGFQDHTLPSCFVCGPERKVDDGLRIFAGRLGASDIVAAPWHVGADLGDKEGAVKHEFIWAALDCPGYFAVKDRAGFALLGDFSVKIHQPAHTGDTLIVSAWSLDSEGRKHRAGSALFNAQGQCIAQAIATWISVPKDAYIAACV